MDTGRVASLFILFLAAIQMQGKEFADGLVPGGERATGERAHPIEVVGAEARIDFSERYAFAGRFDPHNLEPVLGCRNEGEFDGLAVHLLDADLGSHRRCLKLLW